MVGFRRNILVYSFLHFTIAYFVVVVKLVKLTFTKCGKKKYCLTIFRVQYRVPVYSTSTIHSTVQYRYCTRKN